MIGTCNILAVSIAVRLAAERPMQLQLELSYVRHVLKAHRLPGELVRRATKYMRHMASGGGGISLQAVEQLPTGLAIEVMGELVGKLLAQVGA